MNNRLFGLSLIICMSLLLSCSPKTKEVIDSNAQKVMEPADVAFNHGVASGDPTSDAVIIWTRVSTSSPSVDVSWELSDNPDFSETMKNGVYATGNYRDHTVKVDVVGLSPSTKYYYRFKVGDKVSPVGETKTLAESGADNVRLGVVSCSNWQFGYFSAYRHLASKNLDAIIHLGDYFYEHGPDGYGDKSFERKHNPPHEVISLEDYRMRYAQYRTDPDLQLIHRTTPFITIWDDHEITNNAYRDGAENHQPEEGDYMDRKNIAKKVYYEWMPIRDDQNDHHYRAFSFGDQLDLIMLDERLEGRTEQPATIEDVDENDMMLGREQLMWFKDKLSKSDANWKVIGNQVIFSECDLSMVRPKEPKNLDAWDGYAFERSSIIEHIEKDEVDNVIFVTGDTHTSWAFEVPRSIEDYSKTKEAIAIEFGTPSITSSNWNEYGSRTDEELLMAQHMVERSNPHLKYTNVKDHGYMILSLSDRYATAEWYYMDDIQNPKSGESLKRTVDIVRNQPSINIRIE